MVDRFLGDAARRSSGPRPFHSVQYPYGNAPKLALAAMHQPPPPGLICYAKLLCAGGAMAKRKQLNIGLTPVQYAADSAAAEAEGETVTAYCRDTILARAMLESSPAFPG